MCPQQSTSLLGEDLGMTPTQLLGMAIKKRRELNKSKERHYRLELLQTIFIQSLCKHLGERRARRRAARELKKSSETVPTCESMSPNDTFSEASQTRVVPVIQTHEPPQKRSRIDSVHPDPDPFGLDHFFETLKNLRPQKKATTGASSP